MKDIQELNLPDDRRYATDHEWAKADGQRVVVGISDYAQDQLGDIVYVELPKAGDALRKGDPFGSVESVKAVSELFMPIGGEIARVNPALAESPELVNTSPYDQGWMVEVTPSDPGELEALMSRADYLNLLKGQGP